MRFLGIIVAIGCALAGGYGVFHGHDNGGWPFVVAGAALLVYLITAPTVPPTSSHPLRVP